MTKYKNMITLGGYNPSNVNSRMNLQAYSDSLNKLDSKHEKAIETISALKATIGQLDFNAAEDQYKANLLNDTLKRIDAKAQYGSYAGALTEAKLAAGDIISNPGVIGRLKAQQEYKTYVNTIKNNSNLTEDDKSWALAKNPYYYEDKRDNNGNVIGGSEWKPSVVPVGKIDFNKILHSVQNMVFKETGSNKRVMFGDADGNPTNDIRKAVTVMYETSNGWSGISKEKFNSLLEAAIDNEPGARARIDQDWEVLNWKYDTGRIDDTDRELFASNGRKLDKKEWYNNRFGRAVDNMTGMNYTSSIDYDNNYFTYMAAKHQQTISQDKNLGDSGLMTVPSNPIEDVDPTINLAGGAVANAITRFEKIFPALTETGNNGSSLSNRWVAARNSNNYKEMSKILHNLKYNNVSDRLKGKINELIRIFDNNASVVENVSKNAGDFQAYLFNAAFTTGGDLPANNNYTKKYMTAYNKRFENASTIRYKFDNIDELRTWANAVGIDIFGKDSYLNKSNDNNIIIELEKSDVRNYKGLEAIRSILGKNNLENVIGVKNDGNEIDNYKLYPVYEDTGYEYSRVRYIMDGYDATLLSIPNTTQNIANKELGSSSIKTYTGKGGSLVAIDKLRKQRDSGAIDESTFNSRVKDTNNYYNNVLQQLEGSQVEIFVADNDNKVLRKINDARERSEYIRAAKTRIHGDSTNSDLFGTYVANDKVGLSINLPANENKSKGTYILGEIPESKIVIFGLDDPNTLSVQNETGFRATNRYNKLRNLRNINHTFFDGSSISWTNNGPAEYTMPNGKKYPISESDVIAKFNQEIGLEDIKREISNKNFNAADALLNYWINENFPTVDVPSFKSTMIDIINRQMGIK